MSGFRIESDSMGELKVPENALYGAQTQRAVNNFPISGLRMPRGFIRALGLIKYAAAKVNGKLDLLDVGVSEAIQSAALAVSEGQYDEHFPVDVFQTGSGTSSNMNTNEVIAHLASANGIDVHPNDHVNCGQSSNDVIPTAIHVSAALAVYEDLLPALAHLETTCRDKAKALRHITKTGRTHLMDAMPVRFDQELLAWAEQIKLGQKRVQDALADVLGLAQGGTAVGTGINAHPSFATQFAQQLSQQTGLDFRAADSAFERIATQDAIVQLSASLKTVAVSFMKIANDLRLMNSGPLAGISDIALPALQPGSSIMPGKVNPVVPEAICMLSAQVMGNDTAITVGGQAGNFQLNVMLPMIAYNVLQSIDILANGATVLADSSIKGFTVNEAHINAQLAKNPILITALNAKIGYEKGAAIAKKAYAEKRPLLDVALEETDLDEATLTSLLDPAKLTHGGIA